MEMQEGSIAEKWEHAHSVNGRYEEIQDAIFSSNA